MIKRRRRRRTRRRRRRTRRRQRRTRRRRQARHGGADTRAAAAAKEQCKAECKAWWLKLREKILEQLEVELEKLNYVKREADLILVDALEKDRTQSQTRQRIARIAEIKDLQIKIEDLLTRHIRSETNGLRRLHNDIQLWAQTQADKFCAECSTPPFEKVKPLLPAEDAVASSVIKLFKARGAQLQKQIQGLFGAQHYTKDLRPKFKKLLVDQGLLAVPAPALPPPVPVGLPGAMPPPLPAAMPPPAPVAPPGHLLRQGRVVPRVAPPPAAAAAPAPPRPGLHRRQ